MRTLGVLVIAAVLSFAMGAAVQAAIVLAVGLNDPGLLFADLAAFAAIIAAGFGVLRYYTASRRALNVAASALAIVAGLVAGVPALFFAYAGLYETPGSMKIASALAWGIIGFALIPGALVILVQWLVLRRFATAPPQASG